MEKLELEKIKERLRKDKEERKANVLKHFETMHEFKCPDDIPELPITDKETWDNIIMPNLLRCGAIPKNKLEVGVTYIGTCRNTEEATWNGKCFDYKRYKFGDWFDDTINHFEDDDGYDLFVPIKKKE